MCGPDADLSWPPARRGAVGQVLAGGLVATDRLPALQLLALLRPR